MPTRPAVPTTLVTDVRGCLHDSTQIRDGELDQHVIPLGRVALSAAAVLR